MIGLVFIAVFAFSFLCEGTIFLPPEGDTFVVAPGTDAKISWTFNDTNPLGRQLLNQEDVSLAQLFSNGDVVLSTTGKKLGVDTAQPATLILKNVELRHNGTYKFQITSPGPLHTSSSVTVFVAVTPKVTNNCSSPIKVDEGGDVKCLCKAEDANPPGNVNVTWYKDDVQIGDTKKEENMLSLSNVDRTASGTYKCVAQSLTLTNETTINNVIVNFPPNVTSLTSSPTTAVLDQSVTIACEVSGLPSPSYTIIYNGTHNVSSEKTYTIDVVNASHAGSYQCIAESRLGKSSKNYTLIVTSTAPTTPTTPPTPTSTTSTKADTKVGPDVPDDV